MAVAAQLGRARGTAARAGCLLYGAHIVDFWLIVSSCATRTVGTWRPSRMPPTGAACPPGSARARDCCCRSSCSRWSRRCCWPATRAWQAGPAGGTPSDGPTLAAAVGGVRCRLSGARVVVYGPIQESQLNVTAVPAGSVLRPPGPCGLAGASSGPRCTVWLGTVDHAAGPPAGRPGRWCTSTPVWAWVPLYVGLRPGVRCQRAYLWPRTRVVVLDRLAASSVEVGVVFNVCTLISGSIWGKPTWGVVVGVGTPA